MQKEDFGEVPVQAPQNMCFSEACVRSYVGDGSLLRACCFICLVCSQPATEILGVEFVPINARLWSMIQSQNLFTCWGTQC